MYQSLYRKYRPQTFMEIYGQDAISKTLTNAIIYDKVAHAYLFSGTRGTGKTSTAKLLAKALNCTNIVDGKICDECENCLMIKNNSHPDVIEIDAASNNGVEEVRDLIERVKYAPIKGKKKVYIIDEVHMMSSAAFNALLKTLEEPPEHVVFILATTEQHKVIPTIKSRCQKFVFKKINTKDIIKRMEDILNKENITYDVKALEIIAEQADGGMRDALSLLEQVMIYSNNNITIDSVNESLDLASQKDIENLFNLIIESKLDEALADVEKLYRQSLDMHQIISQVLALALSKLVSDKQNDNNDNTKILISLIQYFDEAIERLKYDRSKKMYLELAIIKTINSQKNPIIQENQVVQEPKSIQSIQKEISDNLNNVNKETIVEDKIEPVNSPRIKQPEQSLVDKAELLNVLVQASKEQLNYVQEQWSRIGDYLYNINTKLEASLLIDTNPIVACENAIIILANTAETTLINTKENLYQNKQFMQTLLDDGRYCFAITEQQWQELRNEYIILRRTNQLPQPKAFLENIKFDVKEKQEEEVSDSILMQGQNLFGEDIIIKKGDIKNEY